MQRNVMSPAVIRNTSPLHYLTERQATFVAQVVKGVAPGTAARIAGYSQPETQGAMIVKSPKVQAAIKYSYAKYAQAAQMTRKRVMDGMLEAIEMAKIQADAAVMVSGWREIGRMCGFYAPEVKKIDISITTKRVIDQLETLSDDDLLKMVEENGETIEGEATDVLESIQSASDEALEREFGAIGGVQQPPQARELASEAPGGAREADSGQAEPDSVHKEVLSDVPARVGAF